MADLPTQLWRHVVRGAVGEWNVGEPPKAKDVLVPGATVESVDIAPRRDLDDLLRAVEPFTVDGGVGCGSEEIDTLYETYYRILAEQEGSNGG